jgi:DNA damage-binding protein 1
MGKGSLVMKLSDNEMNFPSMLYGGVHGSIGVIASIPQELYVFLQKVQNNVSKVIRGVGGFSHEQ